MNDVILKCNNIYKKIGKKLILKDISLEVKRGEIVGFIGPNGSGKTTTIKLILGLQKMSKGTIEINGYDIKQDFRNAIKNVGAIVENPDLYMYLSGLENLKISKEYYHNVSDKRIDEVIKAVELENRIKDKVSKYSLGMKQRLGIAQAILHKPNLLILDEPTNGLDPEGIMKLRKLLRNLVDLEGIGILISSHNLGEIENICNRVCIIKSGKIIEETDITTLKNEILEECYIIENENSYIAQRLIDKKNQIIDKEHIKVFAKKREIPEITKKLENNGITTYTVIKEDISLEEAFLRKIGGK